MISVFATALERLRSSFLRKNSKCSLMIQNIDKFFIFFNYIILWLNLKNDYKIILFLLRNKF